MRLVHLALVAAIALTAAACSSGGASSAPATAGPVESVKASAPATRIEVTLTDDLKIEPAAMTVPAGVPVTFVVTNSGTILHEFVLGDEAEQTAHEAEMAAAGGMSMPRDEDMAVGVEPGRTKELTVTFDEPGMVLAGCHVVGHYAAGMKAAVTIE
jgi:uncharacterized cupredoxin-like copper-binding protein